MNQRVELDGKFFKAGTERFFVRGVTYGTFGRNKAGDPFPEPDQVRQDFAAIAELGANTVRVYDLPPPWLIELAVAHGLRLFVSIPWATQSCFLDTRLSRREARTAVGAAVRALAGQPAVFAVALANEIPTDVVRWSGPRRIAAFLDELVAVAHDIDPGCLCTYGNFPTTEYLQPQHLDFTTFNVFLHERRELDDYLTRLQALSEGKPLVLGECGADTRREGTDGQARILAGNLDVATRAGLAGAVVFSFTDDWTRGGRRVEDWEMGLTTAARERRPAFAAVQKLFRTPPAFPVPAPKVSVVVAAYEAGATLRACIESLLELDYPHYEVIVIDDGSTDSTTDITVQFPDVRTLRHRINLGLSTARNLGIRAATGDIVAFLDADCRADRDWLKHLVEQLQKGNFAGVGGPNLLPPDDPPTAAAVMASPGGPTHVLLSDAVAEHVPGCNMAFWRRTLDDIGGFDPIFQQAGDDVDVCWRIQRRGWHLAFAHAAIVWHHRRASVPDYLAQQAGYGEAEALLVAKHPEHFMAVGGARWQGRICAPHQPAPRWRRDIIYHGIFAGSGFQTLYAPGADGLLPILTSLEYHGLLGIPLLVLSFLVPWLWPLAIVAWAMPPALCVLAACRVVVPRDRRRWSTRPLIAILHYLQPVVRGFARYRARLNLRAHEAETPNSLEAQSRIYESPALGNRAFWSSAWRERREWIERIVRTLEARRWPFRVDAGWSRFDLEILGSRWSRLEFVSVVEANRDHSQTLRCRLRRHWTLTADLLFWGALATQLLGIGLFDVNWRGAWVPVVAQGAIAWWLQRQGRSLQARFGVLLDDVARDWKLTPLGGSGAGVGVGGSPPSLSATPVHDPANPPRGDSN